MHVKMSFIFRAMKIAEMESLEGPRACLSDFFLKTPSIILVVIACYIKKVE